MEIGQIIISVISGGCAAMATIYVKDLFDKRALRRTHYSKFHASVNEYLDSTCDYLKWAGKLLVFQLDAVYDDSNIASHPFNVKSREIGLNIALEQQKTALNRLYQMRLLMSECYGSIFMLEHDSKRLKLFEDAHKETQQLDEMYALIFLEPDEGIKLDDHQAKIEKATEDIVDAKRKKIDAIFADIKLLDSAPESLIPH